jgi:hypothetical protein
VKKATSLLVAQRRPEYGHLSNDALIELVRAKDSAKPESDEEMVALDRELFALEEECTARDLEWPRRT